MNKKTLIVIIFITVIFIVAMILLLPKKENTPSNTSDNLEISFHDNASTGYKWKNTISKEGIVEVTSKLDYSSCPEDVDGCGGQIIYNIKPLKEGEVTVTFEWVSTSGEPDEAYTYNIKVDNNLKISETHTKTNNY